jgi:hypothetical protein
MRIDGAWAVQNNSVRMGEAPGTVETQDMRGKDVKEGQGSALDPLGP